MTAQPARVLVALAVAGCGGAATRPAAIAPSTPRGLPSAVLVIIHGADESGGGSGALGAHLAARGIAIHPVELGDLDSVDESLHLVDDRIAEVRRQWPGRPIFVLGRGVGGTIATLYAVEWRPDLRGLILVAPVLRLDRWPMIVGLLRFAGKRQLLGAIERIWAGIRYLYLPVLIFHGENDYIAHPAGSHELFACRCTRDRTLRIVPDAGHDLLAGAERAAVMAEVAGWIGERAAGPRPRPFTIRSGPRVEPPLHPSSTLLIAARWTMVDEGTRGALGRRGLDVVSLDVRSRFAIGGPIGFCTGLDGTIGASNTGTAYGLDAYAFGFVLPSFLPGGAMSACAGFGLSGVRGSIPFAWQFPGEIAYHLPLGPAHVRLWGRAALIAGSERRRDGTDATVGFADEYAAGVEVISSRTRRYWGRSFASGGLASGLMWGDVMGSAFFGVYLGLGATGIEPEP